MDRAPIATDTDTIADLTADETRQAEDRKAASSRVVHEVIRAEGEHELHRPALGLVASGLAGGVTVSVAVLAQGALNAGLPQGAAWTPLIAAFGYALGFVVTIMGRLQLFTETTVSAVLPVATQPTRDNVLRLLRVWGIVLGANLMGTMLVAALIAHEVIVPADQRAAILELSRHAVGHGAAKTLVLAIPAGFLIASIAWILPNARGSEFWVIIVIAWMISAGRFSHVVAGSAEAFTLWLAGEIGLAQAAGGFILPALIGNIIGGTGLFALLAHAQVRGETAGED